MIRESLNGTWSLTNEEGLCISCTVPGSVYAALLSAKRMEDPYQADHELAALKLMEQDYTFTRTFRPSMALLACAHQVLRFDGIDTLADVFLNGRFLGHTDNMHRYWEYDVRGILRDGENELAVAVKSPTRYIAAEDEKAHLGGTTDAMRGFPHLRKAHCMFGWDWGPRLPDQGIWKDVGLLGWNRSRLLDMQITQEHFPEAGRPEESSHDTRVLLTVSVTRTGDLPVKIFLTSPAGEEWELEPDVPFAVPHPQLWWPNGLGEQPLYTVRACLVTSPSREEEPLMACVDCHGNPDGIDYGAYERVFGTAGESPLQKWKDGAAEEVITRRIGLRTVTIRRRPDEWGETFAAEVNGQTFFSMGADYIPEDCILSRVSPERTGLLLADCAAAHFNVIRVWGGGFYPHDYFYDLCDELGLLVWQDLMFACAYYPLTDAFTDNIREEIRQNVRRIRHHACLGLWCGNNEMEQFALEREFDGTDQTAADYLIQYEKIIPEILKEENPQTMYWPSSPSSGGGYDNPRDPDRGDVHYWDVWHAGVPFTAYRNYCFRYLSEFGFQSFPCMETILSFAKEKDLNIFSYVMEMHQRNSGANGKIMQYLSATYLYPSSFALLVYASQLLQAEAIRYGVEHLRRNRSHDRCMGAVYWQLNDNWPVASWSSIDYFGRWKALHYYAARFFAPVMISCEEDSMVSEGRTCISQPSPVCSRARLNVTNETWEEIADTADWSLRDAYSRVLESGSIPVRVLPFSSLWLDQMDFSAYDPREIHFTYRLRNHESSGSVLFAPPKHVRFADPKLQVIRNADRSVTVTAAAYARSVELYSPEGAVRLSDNFFDMEAGSRSVRILEGWDKTLLARSVYDIR